MREQICKSTVVIVRVLRSMLVALVIACRPPTPPTRTELTIASPPNCPRPVHVKAFTTDTVLGTEDVMLPPALNWKLERSAYTYVIYSVDVCGGKPPSIGDVKHRTPLPELDRMLDERITELSVRIQLGVCETVHLRVTGWDTACDWPTAG